MALDVCAVNRIVVLTEKLHAELLAIGADPATIQRAGDLIYRWREVMVWLALKRPRRRLSHRAEA